ncbi:MAG: helix-turn-helix domain-containing protein [Erysipelotrichaceae bacterium]|nr:helix-turn-helix domain-containing protein [Erysipelotrichaceae bacterium]
MINKELIGIRIAKARKNAGKTQANVADELDVSFQAVSSWERGEFTPDTENLIKLAKFLDVSVSSLVEERNGETFKTVKNIYDSDHMSTFVRATAKANRMTDTLKARDFAKKAHEGQKRNGSDIPYIYHPLNLACHCLAMEIREDPVVAACLLHDVIEDTKYGYDDLPVSDETKELVRLMTHEKTNDENREEIMKPYYKGLANDPRASLIKCVDRCNNLTTMSWGLSRDRIYRMIKETEKYVLPLLKVVKAEPDYNNAAWLLQYQMESMLDIYKRLM